MNPEKSPLSERDQVKQEIVAHVIGNKPLPPEAALYFRNNEPEKIIQEIRAEKLLGDLGPPASDAAHRWLNICRFARPQDKPSDTEQALLNLADSLLDRERVAPKASTDEDWGWLEQPES